MLAEDAAREFEKASGVLHSLPSLRFVEPVFDKDVDVLARWRASR